MTDQPTPQRSGRTARAILANGIIAYEGPKDKLFFSVDDIERHEADRQQTTKDSPAKSFCFRHG